MYRAGRLGESCIVFALLCCLITACVAQNASLSETDRRIAEEQSRVCDQLVASWVADSSRCGDARNATILKVIVYHCGYHAASLPTLRTALGPPDRSYISRLGMTVLEYDFDQRCDSPLKDEYDRCWGQIESIVADDRTINQVGILCQ
jgi:hypothetical protein